MAILCCLGGQQQLDVTGQGRARQGLSEQHTLHLSSDLRVFILLRVAASSASMDSPCLENYTFEWLRAFILLTVAINTAIMDSHSTDFERHR